MAIMGSKPEIPLIRSKSSIESKSPKTQSPSICIFPEEKKYKQIKSYFSLLK